MTVTNKSAGAVTNVTPAVAVAPGGEGDARQLGSPEPATVAELARFASAEFL